MSHIRLLIIQGIILNLLKIQDKYELLFSDKTQYKSRINYFFIVDISMLILNRDLCPLVVQSIYMIRKASENNKFQSSSAALETVLPLL